MVTMDLNASHCWSHWPCCSSIISTEGHVKVMLACGHSLSHDHQGFRPFSPDHREAAGPVGPAVTRIKIHCDLQTVPSCALATASMTVMYRAGFFALTRRRASPLLPLRRDLCTRRPMHKGHTADISTHSNKHSSWVSTLNMNLACPSTVSQRRRSCYAEVTTPFMSRSSWRLPLAWLTAT